MKGFIKTRLRESLLREDAVTKSDLNRLEKELDDLFASVNIDVEFTRHFFDRVNDERNGKDITIEELRSIFKNVYLQYKNKLKKYGSGFEAVFKDSPTNINIPFALSWDSENNELDLVNKTVMRKKNFHTPNPELYVTGEDPTKQNNPRGDKFKKYKLPDGEVVKFYSNIPKFETLNGEPIEMDDIFDRLPQEFQEKLFNSL